MSSLARIIVLSGPTGSGKSELAVQLAQRIGGEIISADSVAIYRGFIIGSSAPRSELTSVVPHHLVGILDANASFDAEKFRRLASEKIEEIISRGRVPIVVGGTGLYIRALINGLIEDSDEERDISHSEEKSEKSFSHELLAKLDYQSAQTIHPNDTARVHRAIDYARRTGHSIAQLRSEHAGGFMNFNALILLPVVERGELYRRINERADRMIENNLIQETTGLLADYPSSCKPFSAIGYRHVIEYLQHSPEFDPSHSELKEKIARDTRRFAKRQITWWKNQPRHLGWKEFSDTGSDIVRDFLNGTGKWGESGVFIVRYNFT